MAYDWIGLLTDYGRRDGFVAACHGVIARIAPAVRVIDITHEVPPQDVRHGAAVLAQTLPYLPPSVVVAVVDPGVGTRRRGVAIAAGGYVLVGPDNGLLPWAADALGGVSEAVSLDSREYRLPSRARTFDGRDVFAPAAAHVAAGTAIGRLGHPLTDLVRLPAPRSDAAPGRLETEVLTVDHFGNVQLAAREADLAEAGFGAADAAQPADVEAAGRRFRLSRRATFGDVPPGDPVLYVDAADHVAIAVNRGDAAKALGLSPGDPLTIRPG